MSDEPVGLIEAARARNRAHVLSHEHSHVLIHAGVVANEHAVVVIPGAAESGKSTLTAGLVRAGWRYISDELAMLDPATCGLEPYQRPISIDPGAYAVFPELQSSHSTDDEQWHVDPRSLRPGALAEGDTHPLRVTHVVFNRYEAGAATTWAQISQAACLSGLIGNAVRLKTHGGRGFEVLADVAETAKAFELVSGDLGEQITAIDEMIGLNR